MSNEETRGRPNGERAKALAAGRKYYHTGKPCINGHIAERKTADGKCIECLSSYQYVDLRPRKCANIHCEKVFTPRMRKYKKGFTEQSLKDARLEYCSVQCHREKRKRYFWASGEGNRRATEEREYLHIDGSDHPEEYNWSIEEDTRWYWYLHQCSKTRTKPVPFYIWRLEYDGYNSDIKVIYE